MVSISIALLILVFISLLRLYSGIKKKQEILAVKNKRFKELEYINELTGDVLKHNTSIQDFFPFYLDKLIGDVGWRYHSIFRLDEENQVMPIRFTGHLPDWYLRDFSSKILVKIGDACVGRAAAIKQPVTINAANTDPRFASVQSVAGHTGYRSLTGCPMIGRLKVYASFCTYGVYENMFKVHDIQFLFTIANLYGAILDLKLIQNYIEAKKSNRDPI